MLRLLLNSNKINKSQFTLITNTTKKLVNNKINNFNNNNNNNRFYTTTTNLINNINNEINKSIKESNLFFNNFKNSLNNKQDDSFKQIIENIKNEPTKPRVYYELYIWMKFIETVPIISKFDGTNGLLSTLDVLIKEIENNPNFKEIYLFLLREMKENRLNEIEISTYKSFTNNSTNGSKTKYDEFDLLLIILDLDQNDFMALNKITDLMISNQHFNPKFKIITLLNGKRFEIQSMTTKNFNVNSNTFPSSYFKLLHAYKHLGRVGTTDDTNNGNIGKPFNEVLNSGLIKFPNVSKFYYEFANILTHNYQSLLIPNVDNKELKDYDPTFKQPSSFKQMNRIQLMIKAIELLESSSNDDKDNDKSLLTTYYHRLGDYLDDNNNSVLINGINHNKISLFSKAVELNFSNIFAIKSLIECMEPQQSIKIKNQSFIRETLAHSILNIDSVTGYLLLSKINLQENNIEKFKHFNELYLNSKESFKKLIFEIYSKNPLDYHYLATTLTMDEKVIIDGKEMNKFDCLLKALEIGYYEQPNYYYLLSKYLNDNKSTIKLLNGQSINKNDLLEYEISLNKKNMEAYYSWIENKNFQGVKDKFALLLYIHSNDFKFSKAYLEIGKMLQEDLVDNIKVRLHETNYLENSDKSIIILNRKELFIKYLLLLDPIYPVMNKDNLEGWYHLALELNGENEIQFGKSKKQILLEILDFDNKFSKSYYQLSNLLIENNHQDEIKLNNGTSLNKIQLILNAIDLENHGDSNLKCFYLIGLSKCLSNDKNDKIDLLNGKRYNKQQLLIDICEDYYEEYHFNRNSITIFQDLSNTLDDDYETIQIRGHQVSKLDLLNWIEEIYKMNLDYQNSNLSSFF